ncbi:MAG: PrgI family protein [Patescibacteria group bacterium]
MPQFIEVESKVIGPISVRQFIILLFASGIIFIWYSLFSSIIFVVLSLVTAAIAIVFAFAKVNSQPFHAFALSLIQTLQRPKLSVWQHQGKQQIVVKMSQADKKDKGQGKFTPKPNVSAEHIAELSLIVDTHGKYSPEDIERLRKEQSS